MERIQRALEISRLQRPATEPAPPHAEPHALHAVAPHPAVLPAESHAISSRPLARHPMQSSGLRERCVLLAHDPGPAARAYRMLRAQLLQRVRASRTRVFGIVSAVSGEGKTVTAINLALTLAAEPEQTVALLDFDLRHPSIAQTLGIAPASGLEAWLSTDLPASSLMCEVEGIPRLQIAPALAPLGAGSGSLASGRARELLEELKAQDERRLLILDLPPALLSDDVLTISPLVDGFILIVTEGKTRREDVERVIELVGRGRILGTVLNGSVDSEQRAY